GLGSDRIKGEQGHDVLASGDLAGDFDFAALHAVSQAWADSHPASDPTIDDSLDELIDDHRLDQLTGGSGADLFLINLGDEVTDFVFGKRSKNKGGDVVIRNGVVVT